MFELGLLKWGLEKCVNASVCGLKLGGDESLFCLFVCLLLFYVTFTGVKVNIGEWL